MSSNFNMASFNDIPNERFLVQYIASSTFWIALGLHSIILCVTTQEKLVAESTMHADHMINLLYQINYYFIIYSITSKKCTHGKGDELCTVCNATSEIDLSPNLKMANVES